MAVTVTVYPQFKRNGKLPNALDADTLKLALLTSAYTPDLDADAVFGDVDAAEIAASGGYTAGGKTLTGLTSGVDTTGDFGYLDGDNVNWSALTPSAPFRYGVLYDASDSDRLIQLLDFGADQDPAGTDFPVNWAAPASGGILKVV